MKLIPSRRPAARPRRATWWRLAAVLLAAVAVTGMATYLFTAELFAKNPSEPLWRWTRSLGHDVIQDRGILGAVIAAPRRMMRRPDMPTLVVDVKFKHMETIRRKRREALAKDVLISSSADFVPASIRVGDRTVPVKLRLKGDWTDHLENDKKWSFRIHVKRKDHVLGMRRFSIQHPKVRRFQMEPLFMAHLRSLDVLAPRYFFAKVVLNGEDLGVMAVEEHFSKELLESNRRRESVIVRFDESLVWQASDGRVRGFEGSFDNYRNAPVDAFQSGRIARSARLSKDRDAAIGLLRGFVSGKLKASEVFDATLMGRFLAVSEVWSTHHAIRWHNMRFYLNPLTVRLEPIGFDASLNPDRLDAGVISLDEPMVRSMLEDPLVATVYVDTVRRIARELEEGTLLARLGELQDKHLAALQSEFYFLEAFPLERLKARAARVAEAVVARLREPAPGPVADPALYPRLVHAYLLAGDDGPELELANAVPFETEILSLSWRDANGEAHGAFEPARPLSLPLRLAPTRPGALPGAVRIAYRAPDDANNLTLAVVARLRGSERLVTAAASRYVAPAADHPVPLSSAEEQLSRHRFLAREAGGLRIGPGRWRVEGSLIVPPGMRLTVAAGATLQFSPGGSLIAHGALIFDGEAARPVVLEGRGADGAPGPWQGVAVLDAGAPSRWRHVEVRDTSGINHPRWELTGGVTFYNSDVVIEDSVLRGSRAEDALNVVRSRFALKRVHIADTASDALDSDFSRGTVEGGLFSDIGTAGGGDAVDVSGSEVTVTGTRFERIGDKAVSVGEASTLSASRIAVDGAGTGAASKDGSRLVIAESTIGHARFAGLTAYVKKPEYGAGHIAARAVSFVGPAPPARVQQGSTVTIDDAPVASEDVDVDRLYDTVMKKRSARR